MDSVCGVRWQGGNGAGPWTPCAGRATSGCPTGFVPCSVLTAAWILRMCNDGLAPLKQALMRARGVSTGLRVIYQGFLCCLKQRR